MKKLIILIYLISSTAFAKTQITTIENGVTIYSEFYQKSKSKFKGTIIFENGSGTDLNEWTDNKTFLFPQNFIFKQNKKSGSVTKAGSEMQPQRSFR